MTAPKRPPIATKVVEAVLAVDLGTRCGWANRTARNRLNSGHERFPDAALLRLRAAHDLFVELVAPIAWGRGHLVYEAPVFVNPVSFRVACQLEAVLLLVAADWRVPPDRITSVPNSTVKKHATGRGDAAKEDVRAAIRARLTRRPTPLDSFDEADALAVLGWWLATKGRR